MTRPSYRITSPQAASAAARAVESPCEVEAFEALAVESPSVRAYLQTPEWLVIRDRIMGAGTPPLHAPKDLTELARFMRWSADSYFSEVMISPDARGAYLHAAAEIDAFARNSAARAAAAGDELARRREAA